MRATSNRLGAISKAPRALDAVGLVHYNALRQL
jgi:hypothetical protein